jgi:hypothetical protein
MSPNSRRFDRRVTSTAMPAARKASSRAAAFFTAMPRPAASEVAETSGAAARISTAAAAREVRRRPATAARAQPRRLLGKQQVQRVLGLLGERGEEGRDPDQLVPGRVGLQRQRAGAQRLEP